MKSRNLACGNEHDLTLNASKTKLKAIILCNEATIDVLGNPAPFMRGIAKYHL